MNRNELEGHFETLGLKPNASLTEIEQAYRELVQVWHPDRFPVGSSVKTKAENKMREINLAYKAIKAQFSKRSEVSSSTEAPRESSRGSESSDQPPSHGQQSHASGTRKNVGATEKATQEIPWGFGLYLFMVIPMSLFFGWWLQTIPWSYWVESFIISLLVAFDSRRIELEKYETRIPASPIALFFCCFLFLGVVYPWYIVVQHNIENGFVKLKSSGRINDQPTRKSPSKLIPKNLAILLILPWVVSFENHFQSHRTFFDFASRFYDFSEGSMLLALSGVIGYTLISPFVEENTKQKNE